MLDGLDEIPDVSDRHTCVTALNEFTRDNPGPTVVCCRRDEYEALDVQLEFTAAVVVRPLKQAELMRALRGAGPALAGVRAVLKDDPELRDLCCIPLFLSIIILAYARLTPTQIRSQQPVTQRRMTVLDDYVFRRPQEAYRLAPARGHGSKSEAEENSVRSLSRLAPHMESAKESILLLERMQPDWLPSAVRMAALVPALVLFWLLHYLVGFVAALFPAVILFGTLANSYRFTERLTWSWKAAARPQTWLVAAVLGACIGLLIGLVGGAVRPNVTVWPVNVRLASPLAGVLIGGILGLPVVSGLYGFRASAIATKGSPYEGLTRSLAVGLSVALLAGLTAGVLYAVAIKIAGVQQFATTHGSIHIVDGQEENAIVVVAIYAAVVGGLLFGLGGVLGHVWVRMGLWMTGREPIRYRTWLEQMVQARLLYRSGAGYVFIHLFLQERLSGTDVDSVVAASGGDAASAGGDTAAIKSV